MSTHHVIERPIAFGVPLTVREVVRRVGWLPPRLPAAPSCQPECDGVFARVDVAAATVGGTRVTWQTVAEFADPGPLTAQLEWSASGHPQADDWQAVGPPVLDPAFLVDPEQRVWGTVNLGRYRVVLRSASGAVYRSAPTAAEGIVPERDRLWARELARKEQLRLTATAAGIYGYLLAERRYGVLCSCVDPVTREQANSSCPICFGRRYVGGYHAAIPCWSADPVPEDLRKLVDHAGGRGSVADIATWARMVATLPIVSNDVWVNHASDERYVIHDVRELVTVRGVAVVYGVKLWKAPRTDIVYRVPVARTRAPRGPCSRQPDTVVVCFS